MSIVNHETEFYIKTPEVPNDKIQNNLIFFVLNRNLVLYNIFGK